MTRKMNAGRLRPRSATWARGVRRHGHELVEWIAQFLERLEDYPVLAQVAPRRPQVSTPAVAPGAGRADAGDSGRRGAPRPARAHALEPPLVLRLLRHLRPPPHLGELLSAVFDAKSMLWRTSPASTELEEVTLSWLRQMMGLPAAFDGLIYDTASVATMHAVAAAREALDVRAREDGMSGRADLPLLRLYSSEQAHSSVEKALIALGLGQRSLRKVAADSEFRMRPRALAEAIDEDRRAGALPFCVVATVGTTSTSSIDPVPEVADVCERERLWLHVDAAYAGSAAVVPRCATLLGL